MTDHFHNFAPADAVQYDGTDESWEAIAGLFADTWGVSGIGQRVYLEDLTTGDTIATAAPGQWLVRPVGDTRVWVQDEEPPRVERWEGSHSHDYEMSTEHRPILSNGWTGPWTPVEGGGQ